MATVLREVAPARLGPVDPGAGLSWIIERAGRAVGYLVLTIDPDDRVTRRAYVSALFVEPEERGKGLGPLAQRFAADIGRALGLRIHAAGLGGEDKALPPRRGAGPRGAEPGGSDGEPARDGSRHARERALASPG